MVKFQIRSSTLKKRLDLVENEFKDDFIKVMRHNQEDENRCNAL
jgi:hypothetical protein